MNRGIWSTAGATRSSIKGNGTPSEHVPDKAEVPYVRYVRA